MTKHPFTILCPLEQGLRHAPEHLTFGSGCFEAEAEAMGCSVGVKRLYYRQGAYAWWRTPWLAARLTMGILLTRHDALYYTIDPKYIYPLAVLRRLGLYRKPIYAWKYIAIGAGSGGRLARAAKRLVYGGFAKIFMLTERHVAQSAATGLIDARRLHYMKWGEDLAYADRFTAEKPPVFTFITTGKAHRDFATLCQAFARVEGARLKVFAGRRWGHDDYEPLLREYAARDSRISVTFADEIEGNVLDRLFAEMRRSHCALSICRRVNFGVGYTQVLDSMACALPVIATRNPDNPIDIDAEDMGCTVEPADVAGLAAAMQRMVDEPGLAQRQARRARELAETDYDIRRVARDVLALMLPGRQAG